MSWYEWYTALNKPSWTPTGDTIGTIWGILYSIIVISFGFVLIQALRSKIPAKVLIPFGINLTANLLFSPIQFGLRNLALASVDILIVWSTIIWASVAIWKYYRWVAIAQIPYFVWVSIATVLQLNILFMNQGE